VCEQKEKDLFPQNARLAQLSDSLYGSPSGLESREARGTLAARRIDPGDVKARLYRRLDAQQKSYAAAGRALSGALETGA